MVRDEGAMTTFCFGTGDSRLKRDKLHVVFTICLWLVAMGVCVNIHVRISRRLVYNCHFTLNPVHDTHGVLE
jgi:hypothetical protein